MFTVTRSDEIIMIDSSYFLWKKKSVRVEIFQKSVKDMHIL